MNPARMRHACTCDRRLRLDEKMEVRRAIKAAQIPVIYVLLTVFYWLVRRKPLSNIATFSLQNEKFTFLSKTSWPLRKVNVYNGKLYLMMTYKNHLLQYLWELKYMYLRRCLKKLPSLIIRSGTQIYDLNFIEIIHRPTTKPRLLWRMC